jgi:RimJ/RimL family protein N-acetyltransferase
MQFMLTPRLELVPATVRLLTADLEGPAALGKQLDAEIPSSWPPELYDDDARRYSIDMLQRDPANANWPVFYILLRTENALRRKLIGIAGYKGHPAAARVVEVGYGVLPEFRRRGFASEAVRGLIERAFDNPEIDRVAAETFPDLIPSIGVMVKNGMSFVGEGSEEGVIRYEVTREAWG